MKEVCQDRPKSMILKKYADARWVRSINDFLESRSFIALVAFLTLCSNVFGWEFFIYTLIITYGYYLCLFARDMRSLAAVAPFMYASPSVANNPAANPDSIFYPQNGLWLLIAYLVGFFALLIVRIALNYKDGTSRFFSAKRGLLSGFLTLGGAFLLGGVGQAEYTFLNLRYALLLFVSLFLFYYCLIALVDWRSVPRDYFAWVATFFGLLLVFELLNVYMSAGVISAEGRIDRSKIYTGWGINNNIGGMLICCLPAPFYLAATKRHGYVFTVVGSLTYLAIVFTTSRNSILVGTFLFAVSAVLALWNRKNRKANMVAYGTLFVLLVVLLILFWDIGSQLFDVMIRMGLDDSGRFDIWRRGLQQFFSSPLTGKGFYACDAYLWGSVDAMTFVPPRWHNTPVQILASCGTVGALAYAYHRWQTVKIFLKKPNLTKIFIGLCVGAVVLGSLLDCHLFNIGPGLFYSVGLSFAEKEGELRWGRPLLLGDAGYTYQRKTN